MSLHALNADLHCHSTASDGTLAPADLVRRAHGNGVQLLALTDHDEVAGLDEAGRTAAQLGLAFVPGVEVSVTWAGQTIHVVGLGVDVHAPALLDGLAAVRSGRDTRGREIGEQLAAAGVPDAYEGAMRFAGNPALLARPHFARCLVDRGVCADVHEVFQRFLVEGKPGYVPHRWARLPEAVGWIRAAGGIAVLAHPGRYKVGATQLWALIGEFREAGGRGIEVVTGSHTPAQYAEFAGYAREFGLLASRGSDFHSPEESRVDLGRLPVLPPELVPVWAELAAGQALAPAVPH